MKRILIVLLCLLPLGLNAQILGERHHLEAGIGAAIPGEFFFETDFNDKTTVDLYGEYRFDITPAIALGAIYTFVGEHTGLPATEDGNISSRKLSSHGINAFAEFKYRTGGPVNFFIGLGGGAGITHLKFSESTTYSNFLRPEASVHAGLEIYDHLRVTIRHNHDLYFPFSSMVDRGFPYYCVNIGWSF